LRVLYKNNENDCVCNRAPDTLLLSKILLMFCLLSEKRWININRDPIRGFGGVQSGQIRGNPNPPQRG